MHTNLEIELKTLITKEKYEELIKAFALENNVYTQINHYFDTKDCSLQKKDMILRIRQKTNSFKLTNKCHSEKGAFETHIILSKEEALKMINDGFNANIINLDFSVIKQCELTTYRCKTPYKNGLIFFDMSCYYGNCDYEIEYEGDTLEQCEADFKSFLMEYNIEYTPTISKSSRAFKSLDKL